MYQIPVRSGNVVRENMATVLFFKTMIDTVSKVMQWVPDDQVKEFKSVMRSELDTLGWSDQHRQILAVPDLGTGDVRHHDTRMN